MKNSLSFLAAVSVFFFLTTKSNGQAPDWLWAHSEGGTAIEYSPTVAVDAFGNAYMTGWFGSSTIVYGVDTLVTAGGDDLFLVKSDENGNVIWAKSAGGLEEDQSYFVTTDISGNIYITGYYWSSNITFGTDTLSNLGKRDVFIVKYDCNGNVLWAKSQGDAGEDVGFSVAIDNCGNIYVAGFYTSQTITFGSFTLINAGSSDLFLVKYDTGGNVLWATSAGGIDSEVAYSVVVDALGNPYLTGRFCSPNLTFESDTLMYAGEGDLFLAKFDSSGNVLWASSAGGTGFDVATSVAVDGSGNTYLAGYFESSDLIFSPDTLINAGGADVFLAKYDRNGNVIWAKSAEGTNGEGAFSVAVDAAENAYLAGHFCSPTLTLGPCVLLNTGDFDVFLAKYNCSGSVLWATNAVGTEGDYASSVALDTSGNTFLAGYFYSPTLSFGSITLANVGSFDVFLAKLENDAVGFNDSYTVTNLSVYPNPATEKIAFTPTINCLLSIYNTSGQQLLQQEITKPTTTLDVSRLPSGVYIVKVVREEGIQVGKFVKQ